MLNLVKKLFFILIPSNTKKQKNDSNTLRLGINYKKYFIIELQQRIELEKGGF